MSPKRIEVEQILAFLSKENQIAFRTDYTGKALAFHQFNVAEVGIVVGSRPCNDFFSPVTPGFLPPQ